VGRRELKSASTCSAGYRDDDNYYYKFWDSFYHINSKKQEHDIQQCMPFDLDTSFFLIPNMSQCSQHSEVHDDSTKCQQSKDNISILRSANARQQHLVANPSLSFHSQSAQFTVPASRSEISFNDFLHRSRNCQPNSLAKIIAGLQKPTANGLVILIQAFDHEEAEYGSQDFDAHGQTHGGEAVGPV
jgi:hypothetical protein